ncbi:hypothetical protein GZ22_18595 (plasmid) [Terribacillus saccharophilus]|uniref:TIR domain-containing protein n=1 Tax=Terribacillus saccharophilus TaxID=361277 RepID=A0A075LVD5_9BACI|nr:toll/interleukin-1 receptor domain-containing protein [Terribacillus goriensis]AIF68433.1 hypothetical protein GZ22_18595 [Terribacillus goriensis]
MYAKFDLQNIHSRFFEDYHYEIGNRIFDELKIEIEKTLENFISVNGSIDATKLKDNWFPTVDADIFLSHSHADRDKAITLAGWLYKELGLRVFIDSSVWGYANDLLKTIDKAYCLNDDQKTYNYDKRNYSTSHVHTMLTTALVNMIDNSECLFFLNTPNSINVSDVVESKTSSPWIFMELETSKMIRRLKPIRLEPLKKAFAQESAFPKFDYRVDFKDMNHVDESVLSDWRKKFTVTRSEIHALDILYDHFGIIQEQTIINE